jgi:glycosyltransferase involved in cell wall biosynthesis
VDIPSQQQSEKQRVRGADHRPVVVLSANNCWNLVNFRAPLLTGLQDAGYRLVAFAPIDDHANELRDRGIEVRSVPIARSGMNPITDARLLGRYTRMLRSLRPAAYCGFTIKPNVYGAIAARLAGVPAINNVTGLATPYLSEGLVWAVAERLYRFAFKRSHTVFYHNAEDLELMLERKVVRPDQGRVIPGSGVNLEHFRPSDDEPDAGPLRFLFFGRLIDHKGVREFIDAARILRASMPDLRFQLLGNPDPGNPTSVSKQELQSWIDEGFEHLGEHRDVRPYIRQASAVVLPTYREGLSRALLEGAAMGKPLIGTDVAGSRDLIDDGETGLLCRPRDANSLADAMRRLAGMSREQLGEMGRAGRLKAEREFSEDVVVRAYIAVLAAAVRAGAQASLRPTATQ